MTDDAATPPTTDEPGGGRRRSKRLGTGKYPVQMVLMVSTPVGSLIEALAEERGLHKTEVMRTLIHAGIRKAGYGHVLTTDKRERPITDLEEGK